MPFSGRRSVPLNLYRLREKGLYQNGRRRAVKSRLLGGRKAKHQVPIAAGGSEANPEEAARPGENQFVSAQIHGIVANGAGHFRGAEERIENDFFRPGNAANFFERFVHGGFRNDAGFGAAGEKAFDGVDGSAVNVLGEGEK